MARGVIQDASASIGSGSSVTLLAADGNRTFLFIANGHATQTVGVNLSGGTALIGGAGTITLAAGGSLLFDFGVPTNAITAIASGSATPVCVQYMQGGTASA